MATEPDFPSQLHLGIAEIGHLTRLFSTASAGSWVAVWRHPVPACAPKRGRESEEATARRHSLATLGPTKHANGIQAGGRPAGPPLVDTVTRSRRAVRSSRSPAPGARSAASGAPGSWPLLP